MKGGKRKDAGRKTHPPHLKKRVITVRLHPELVEWMKSMDGSYSTQVTKALIRQRGETK